MSKNKKKNKAKNHIDQSHILAEVVRLNPIDDIMFCKMAEDKEFCQEILRTILDDDNLIVKSVTPQWVGKNLKGRSVILDVKCVRGDGKIVNIEVQKSDNDDHQKRVRYNGSVLTTNVTKTGTKFKNVPDVCVVYISRFDVFGKNKVMYHIDRTIRETGDTVYNGFEEIYVTATVRDGSDVSELMRIFTEDGAYNDKFPVTSESKRIYKETEGGRKIMCDIVENLVKESKSEGEFKANKATAKRLIKIGKMTLEEIATATNLPLETVNKLNAKKSAKA